MKRVVCVSANKSAIRRGQLTVGKSYVVVKEFQNSYIIIDNFALKPLVSKTKFKEAVEVLV
jgi:hypothetical protein